MNALLGLMEEEKREEDVRPGLLGFRTGRGLRRWGLQVDLVTFTSKDPEILFSLHHLWCPRCKLDMLKFMTERRQPPILRGVTLLVPNPGLIIDPAIKVIAATIECFRCECYSASLFNSDGARLL